MSLLANEIERAVNEVQSFLEANTQMDAYASPVFTWNGTDYHCIAATSSKSKRLEDGGFTFDNDLLVTVKTSVFIGGFPKPKQLVKFKGDQYRIESIKATGDGAVTTLACDATIKSF